jgi:hypothetical protein
MTKLAIVGATDTTAFTCRPSRAGMPRLPQAGFHIIGQCHYRADTRRLIGHRHLGLTFRWIGGAVASPRGGHSSTKLLGCL